MKKIYKNLAAVALIAIFMFGLSGIITVHAYDNPTTVDLGTAGNFMVLSKTKITTTGATLITGDIGISPAFSTDLEGFSPVLDISGKFSKSIYVTGEIYAANYVAPTPAELTAAVSAMEAAYTNASGRSQDVLDLLSGTLPEGLTLARGIYKWGSNVNITGNITLSGNATDIWIFIITGNLDISSAKSVLLTGGALPANIFWAVAGTTTLETTSTFEGNILAGPATSNIAMLNGATLHGKALGQKIIALDANTISAADIIPPTGTVTLGTAVIYEGDLIQEVIVTYDEAMAPASTPTIVFGTHTGAITSAGAGVWFTDRIWHESFNVADANEERPSVTVGSSGATDLALNPEGASTTGAFAIDTIAPTVVITDDESGVANIAGGDVVYTFTFSETVTGFVIGGIVVAGGAKGAFAIVSGTVYTLAVTPTPNSIANITVDVAGGVAIDAASNGNTAAVQSVQAVDTIAPTVVITDDESGVANIAGGDVVYTFTFSETVTGFVIGGIVVAGGAKGAFAIVSGTVYTLAVTPTPNSIANITVDVAGGVAIDAASNGNTAAVQSVQAVDTIAPTVAVTMSDYVLNIEDTALVTFTFSETPTGFAVEDITGFPNGVLTGFAVTGDLKIYTATFTPNTEVNDTTNVITVGADWTDVVGNAGSGDDSLNYTIDTVSPRRRSTPQEGTINVVKTVINDNGGTKTIADFPLFINSGRVISGVTNTFSTFGTYTITETTDPQYTRTFSGDCDADGQLSLNAGENKFCVITNNDIGAPVVAPPVPPLIEVLKTASPLSLPAGSGSVIYTYTLRNIGTVPATNITMVGDTCSPIVLVSGDINNDLKLDVNETWVHTCSTILTATHTNTIVATGWANGISAVDIASATVVVGAPIVPPLIHVVKVPSSLTLLAGGGAVTYSYTVTNPGTAPLSNVTITDDKCTGLPGRVVGHPGDLNGNNLLEPNEIWSFTCQSNINQTTVNTATASGEANGLVAKDLALATVVVAAAVPKLPSTGFPPEENGITWNLTFLFGIFMLAAVPLAAVLKRHKV